MSKFSSRFSNPKERQEQGTFDAAKRRRQKRMKARRARLDRLGVGKIVS